MDPTDPRLDELARRMSGLSEAKQHQQADFLRLLGTPLLRSLASGVGVNVEDLLSQHRDVRAGTTALLQAAIWFGPFGWTVTPRQLTAADYIEAVRIWERSLDESAVDQHLTRAWAHGDGVWLRGSFGPLTTLAGRHEATLDLLLERDRLLQKAIGHHERGDYEASTLLVLTQVDGLTSDFTDGTLGFFYGSGDQHFEDDATVAGMPEFLRRVRRAVNRDDKATSLSSAFRRHPIVHGRYLAFGTETNSTKAFALMSGVLEWLRPRAAALTERRQADHEGADVTYKGVDADARLDIDGNTEA